MKKTILLLAVMLLGLSTVAQATLINRGGGTSAHGTFNLIYDTDLNITWYDYLKGPGTWQDQMNWASNLSVTSGSQVFNDWRLPTTVYDPNAEVWGLNGNDTAGYHVTGSEMGHLFYTELGNLGLRDASGSYQAGWGLLNTGPFQYGLGFNSSSTEYSPDPNLVWAFSFGFGLQYVIGKGAVDGAMAVHPGDVGATPVTTPEPGTWMLLGSGLAGLAAFRKRFARK